MKRKNVIQIAAVFLFVLLIVGCGQAPVAEDTAVPPTTAPTVAVEASTAVSDTVESEAQEPTAEAEEDAPTATSPSEETGVTMFNAPSQTNGEVLILFGQVLDVNGDPVPNAAVEIWQTDSTGVYDHPGDPGTNGRDTTFQFYGTAVSDSDGNYTFRTIIPGRYEPRPRHIHFKVKQGGETLLTSQFYFSDDIAEVSDEGIFQTAGDSGDLLLLQLVQGDEAVMANGRIVVDTGIGSGNLPLTPSQTEGPYYPIVDVSGFDNDLVVLP